MNAKEIRTPLGVLGLAVLQIACHTESHLPPAESLPAARVETMVVKTEALNASEAVAGTVRARLQSTLEAKLPGRIRAIRVKVGDDVKRGQIVAELEAREVEARLRQAEAVLAQAKADLDRYTALYNQKASTRQELESVRTRHAVAVASVNEAKSMLAEATVRAPFDGVITQDLADVGDLATPGRPILAIEAPGALRLEVAVSEALVGFVEVGQSVPVQLGEAIEVTGTVGEVAPSADPNSRTFLVKIDLPEREGIRTGQFGRALLPTRQAEILRLPVEAVVRRGQLEIVFVVEDLKARLRLVKTGKRFGDRVEVVSGLNSGETVVIEGATSLLDGQPVEVAR